MEARPRRHFPAGAWRLADLRQRFGAGAVHLQFVLIHPGRDAASKVKIRDVIRSLPVLLLLVFGSGCVTYQMWDTAAFDAYNEPAGDPRLRIYRAPRDELLVVYQEYSERKNCVRPRAF